jgi:hypothetical protein
MARKLRRKDQRGANRQDMVTIALLPGSGLGVRSVQRVAIQLEQVCALRKEIISEYSSGSGSRERAPRLLLWV